VERRAGKLVCLQLVKTNHGFCGHVVLAFEAVKERALGDPCRSADIIDGGGVESAMAHEIDAGIALFRATRLFGIGLTYRLTRRGRRAGGGATERGLQYAGALVSDGGIGALRARLCRAHVPAD